MTRLQYTLIVSVVLAAMVTFVACSPDRIEEDVEETVLLPEVEPEPDWVDGVVTIQVGRFQTGAEMLEKLESMGNHVVNFILKESLSKPEFPMSHQLRTVEVAVVTLLEAGFDKPVTLDEIRERYRELGYRPLTLEEAVELRIQFTDQPPKVIYDYVEAVDKMNKMGEFNVLMTKREARLIYDYLNTRATEPRIKLYRSVTLDKYGEGYGISASTTISELLNPLDENLKASSWEDLEKIRSTRFACAIIE